MPPAIPLATYRLQLTKDFGFDDAARLVPYLKELGVSHLYASPFLKARPGSQHGYDIVDHNALNPELGGDKAFARLTGALKEADLGLILDFVPNHMAVGAGNAWWMDVLEWGQKSPRAAAFDIAWELLPYRPGGGVLLPVLGRPYGDALTHGEIELKYDPASGGFSVWYFDHRFPINPQRYSLILKTVLAASQSGSEAAREALVAVADDYSRPGSPSYAAAPTLKQRLAAIDGGAEIIADGLKAYRADHEAGVHMLNRLLERQHYRLAFWRLAPSAINYRRFFDINELAGLRVEDPRTFRDIHRLVLHLIGTGQLHGLRLDHIDGLFDPLQYARRLQQAIRQARGASRRPFYVVVEKILHDEERLPPMNGIAGTTGYEWLNVISRLLVDEAGRKALGRQWAEIDPDQGDFSEVLEHSKDRVLDTIMASEFNVLAQLLARIAAGHFTSRDYAPDRLREALRLYVLHFPIYRTYCTASGCAAVDREVIERTIAAARRGWHGTDADIFDFLRDAVTLDLLQHGPYSRTRLRQFALKLQQFTGPMMAKSMEDTALYRYHALLALNEVGGDPTLPGVAPDEFHARMARRRDHFGHGLTATASHDTKRGEDARMRILALSEIPELWARHVARWRELNARFVVKAGDRRSPSGGHEYMLYQALIGAWLGPTPTPDFVSRIDAYATKAAREGKLDTSWISPNEDYERGLTEFIRAILDPQRAHDFLDSFESFAHRTALMGALNSLSQLTLKATMPGVPDFYQGTELWDLSLVDPDNRRPVDFAARRESLGEPDWPALMASWHDGRIKLTLTQRLLLLRQYHPALFQDGDYQPVEVTGKDSDRVVAFTRRADRTRLLVAIVRHFAPATDNGERWPRADWNAELKLDRRDFGTWRDALGSGSPCSSDLSLSHLLATLPIAVLVSG